MNTKLILSLVLSIVLISNSISQSLEAEAKFTLKGQVVDKDETPLDFANVILLTSGDSSFVKGAITDADGYFTFNELVPSSSILKINTLGFDDTYVNVDIDNDLNIGKVLLTSAALALDEITVKAARTSVKREVDRMVVDVANTIRSSQGDALEVLKLTPGINVTNDQIAIVGKSTVNVMINDKILKLSGDDITQLLKSIASEDISSIEVITTPPARYEASGNSGLVNIKLKKALKDSWNAQVRSGYWQRTHVNENAGASLNFKKNKVSLSASGFYRDGKYQQDQDDYAFFDQELWYTLSPFVGDITGWNTRLDFNYEVSNRWSLGAQVYHNETSYAIDDEPYTSVTDMTTDNLTAELQSIGFASINPSINSYNINSDIKLDTMGKSLQINLDYFTYDNPDIKNYTGSYDQLDAGIKSFYNGINENFQSVDNTSLSADFILPSEHWDVETGVKWSISKSDNEIESYNSGFTESPILDFQKENTQFDYDEEIQAAYISGQRSVGDALQLKLGIRTERTITRSKSSQLNLDQSRKFLQLFPTAYLSYNVTESKGATISYSRRIQRPAFFELNPNIYFVNPFQTIEGNPFLQPSYVHNVELSYNDGPLTSKIYFSSEQNSFGQIALPDPITNKIRFTNENYLNIEKIGISSSYQFNKISRWSSYNSADLNYADITYLLDDGTASEKGFNSRISSNNNITLNEKGSLRMGVNYWYQFPSFEGLFRFRSRSSLDLSFQYFLSEKGLSFALRGNDLLRQQASVQSATVNGVYQEAEYYYDSRSFYFSVSYSFGNKSIRPQRHKTGNQDERNRTGG